jgi:hypothetical protein
MNTNRLDIKFARIGALRSLRAFSFFRRRG